MGYANINLTDKNRIKIVAALQLNGQTTCPYQLGQFGFWHSNAIPKTLLRGTNGIDRGVLRTEGLIPAARAPFSVNPANGNTVVIGGATFQFVTALGAAGANTQVLIGASAAASLASLLNAINGVADATVVPATSPFAQLVVADAVTATVLRLRAALTQGGTPLPSVATSTALAITVTGGASAWSVANLNASGKAGTDCLMSFFQVVITAAMVTNASFQAELPFTPTAFTAFVTASTGVQRASTDAVTISGNAINIALAGGASPAIQAGDIVRVWAIE